MYYFRASDEQAPNYEEVLSRKITAINSVLNGDRISVPGVNGHLCPLLRLLPVRGNTETFTKIIRFVSTDKQQLLDWRNCYDHQVRLEKLDYNDPNGAFEQLANQILGVEKRHNNGSFQDECSTQDVNPKAMGAQALYEAQTLNGRQALNGARILEEIQQTRATTPMNIVKGAAAAPLGPPFSSPHSLGGTIPSPASSRSSASGRVPLDLFARPRHVSDFKAAPRPLYTGPPIPAREMQLQLPNTIMQRPSYRMVSPGQGHMPDLMFSTSKTPASSASASRMGPSGSHSFGPMPTMKHGPGVSARFDTPTLDSQNPGFPCSPQGDAWEKHKEPSRTYQHDNSNVMNPQALYDKELQQTTLQRPNNLPKAQTPSSAYCQNQHSWNSPQNTMPQNTIPQNTISQNTIPQERGHSSAAAFGGMNSSFLAPPSPTVAQKLHPDTYAKYRPSPAEQQAEREAEEAQKVAAEHEKIRAKGKLEATEKAFRIVKNRKIFCKLIARGDDVLAYRLREYMDTIPSKAGQPINSYYTNLLANQPVMDEEINRGSEGVLAVLYAKERWWNYWEKKDMKMVIERMKKEQWTWKGPKEDDDEDFGKGEQGKKVRGAISTAQNVEYQMEHSAYLVPAADYKRIKALV
jgi:hypothetical protein